jgi:hypothetical protein
VLRASVLCNLFTVLALGCGSQCRDALLSSTIGF